MDCRHEIVKFLTTAEGHSTDVFFELYNKFLTFSPQIRPRALYFLCEVYKLCETDHSNFIITDLYTPAQSDYAESLVAQSFPPRLKSLLQSCIQNKCDYMQFYTAVWNEISASPVYSSTLERAIALKTLVTEAEMPYSCYFTNEQNAEFFPGFQQSERIKEYAEHLDTPFWKEVEEVLTVKNPVPYLTQELLLNLFSRLKTREEQLIFFYMLSLNPTEPK
ncbi:MAG: hypothetical protein IJY86_11275 [Clostridia bacterium]|nr:hypothetical protein [Clostridia bacterium]